MTKYSVQMLFLWCFVNLVLLILFFLGIYKPMKGDFSGVFHDRNVFSITTCLVMAFSIAQMHINPKKLYKMVIYFGLISCAVMILISKSITGLLGLLVLCLFLLIKLPFRQRCIICITLVITLIILLLIDNPISARIDRFFMAISGNIDSLRVSESAYLRVYIFQHGFDLFSQHKWVGVGLNNAKNFVIWPNRGVGTFLHNTYLDILTSGGIPLFIVYYFPIIYSLIWLLKNKKKVLMLSDDNYYLWKLASVLLTLKLVYDLTWTSYFEFFMVFTVMFSIYIVFHLKTLIRKKIA
ncbi:O-antigen ligase family protein [Vibrio neonatus]|uniref:O-antigen ligase family protein n=2 Tax=Vibrio neonatus TaxID=278860 RepID=UPI0021C295F7|nr:O-antigen ligase family protein [Vibrio neonatus]